MAVKVRPTLPETCGFGWQVSWHQEPHQDPPSQGGHVGQVELLTWFPGKHGPCPGRQLRDGCTQDPTLPFKPPWHPCPLPGGTQGPDRRCGPRLPHSPPSTAVPRSVLLHCSMSLVLHCSPPPGPPLPSPPTPPPVLHCSHRPWSSTAVFPGPPLQSPPTPPHPVLHCSPPLVLHCSPPPVLHCSPPQPIHTRSTTGVPPNPSAPGPPLQRHHRGLSQAPRASECPFLLLGGSGTSVRLALRAAGHHQPHPAAASLPWRLCGGHSQAGPSEPVPPASPCCAISSLSEEGGPALRASSPCWGRPHTSVSGQCPVVGQ